MQSKQQFCTSLFRIISRVATVALAMATVFALTVVVTQSGQAQTYKVLYNFTGGADGGIPGAGVALDSAGNLYGTNLSGNGTVFKLAHSGSGWVFSTLYTFLGGNDRDEPYAEVTIGSDGSPYSTTLGRRGARHGLQPSPHSDGLQNRKVPLDGKRALYLPRR